MRSPRSQHHIVRLCLAPEIRSAVIKFMAKNDLDKEFAAQLLLVKALYQDKLISKEVYEVYSMRYSRKLVPDEPLRPLTLLDQQEQQRLEEKTRYFKAILSSEWQVHESAEWRRKVLMQADEWKGKIPVAKLVLDLGARQK